MHAQLSSGGKSSCFWSEPSAISVLCAREALTGFIHGRFSKIQRKSSILKGSYIFKAWLY